MLGAVRKAGIESKVASIESTIVFRFSIPLKLRIKRIVSQIGKENLVILERTTSTDKKKNLLLGLLSQTIKVIAKIAIKIESVQLTKDHLLSVGRIVSRSAKEIPKSS